MYGKGLVSNGEMNQHKAMAEGKTKAGDATSFKSGNQTRATSSAIGELGDAQRGIGTGGGNYGNQPAPDHGDRGKDHHRRGGLL